MWVILKGNQNFKKPTSLETQFNKSMWLSKVQQRRLLKLAGGMSIREIARQEGTNFRTVHESVEAGRKKIMVEICFCIGTYIICMSAPIFMDSQSRVAFVE